jgi:uncharacterized membrane protein
LAGIGLTVERLTSRGTFTGTVQALTYSCLVSCGPWLFTISCLGAMTWVAARYFDESVIPLFGNIVIYNFAFSLVLIAPISTVCNRYVADCLYLHSTNNIFSTCIGAMAVCGVLSIAVSLTFYFVATDISNALATAASVNFILVSMIWLIPIFIYAIKDYGLLLMAFASGMLVAFLTGTLLMEEWGSLGMLWGLNAGLIIIVFVALGIAMSLYPYDLSNSFNFLYYFKRYRDLAVSGFIYNAGIWSDKWVMWFSDDRVAVSRFLVFNPIYDFPMFLASLSIIPALALMMIHNETGFLNQYNAYYKDIEGHRSYSWIAARGKLMTECILRDLKDIVLLQASLTLCILSLAPLLVEMFGGEFRQIAIFRLGTLAAFFQAIFIFVTIKLYYFDLRTLNLGLQTLFLICNVTFTYICSELGFAFYGYGYMVACLVASICSLFALEQVIKNINYITFVSNNPSIRRNSPRSARN